MSEFTVEQKEMLDDEYSKLIYRNEQLEADYNELGELYDNLMEQFEDLQRQVDTQKMINTLRESQPDQTTRTFLKIIIETTQYQLEQLVEYLTHNGFLITELKQIEDYNE